MDKQTTYIYIERLQELTPARARVMYVYRPKFCTAKRQNTMQA
jgi:hypothetical protein